jgi:hypothetical protein
LSGQKCSSVPRTCAFGWKDVLIIQYTGNTDAKKTMMAAMPTNTDPTRRRADPGPRRRRGAVDARVDVEARAVTVLPP